jgi:Cu/Ag efflux protein CusF
MIRYSILSVFVFSLLCACRQAVPLEKTYSLRGVIVTINPQTRTATIKHEKIGDWMDAMTMEFPVKDAAEFAKLQPHQNITATVHTRPDTFEYWIVDIHVEAP